MHRATKHIETKYPDCDFDLELRHFILLGNGGTGTSLLRGLLNAHSEIDCLFEYWSNKIHEPKEHFRHWHCLAMDAEIDGGIFGNKIPYEQFKSRNIPDEDIVNLIESFNIIVISRRMSKYLKPTNSGEDAKQSWRNMQDIYWQMREIEPAKVISVSFEDLLLRHEIELQRICCFLDVDYEKDMLAGTKETGHGEYNQGSLNLDKV